jgi:hypothetical protein
MSKHSYSYSHVRFSTDFAPLDYAFKFKEALIQELYIKQVDYWNKQLYKLSEKNVACYAREDAAFNNTDHDFVGLFYDGEPFFLLPRDEDDDLPSPYCLEVYKADPELQEDMRILASELRKFRKERYEVQRFLAGLSMFEPPPKILLQILGDGLYRICQSAYNKLLPPASSHHYEDLNWEVNEPDALKTFVHEQQDIITAMQERVLLNMITL